VTAVIDPFILDKAPGPLVEVPDALVRARAAFAATLDALAGITHDRLTCAWTWDGHGVDVRYGFYRVLEILEPATAASSRALAGRPTTQARDAVAATTASRWALQGILSALSDADLDAEPGGGEWTIRQTMGHIIGGQRGYAWATAWWLSRSDEPRPEGAQRPPIEVFGDAPEDDEESVGSLATIRQALDDVVDSTSSRFATLTDDELRANSGWSGFPVDVAFRQWRWSSHIAEHTIQIEKTLDLLGRRRSEVDWQLRLISRAFGDLDATVFGRSDATAAEPVLDDVARKLNDIHPALVAAAEANVPAPEW
jgi:uncharacterized damage-inducible protein DinB